MLALGGYEAIRGSLVRPQSRTFLPSGLGPLSAQMRSSGLIQRSDTFDPEPTFEIGSVKGREARESGLWVKSPRAAIRRRRRKLSWRIF
jgi:hypothetical protein